MKAGIALVFATMLTGTAFAGSAGNQSPGNQSPGNQAPAAPANCIVQDSTGQQLQVKNSNLTQDSDGAQLLTGSTDQFEYAVSLKADKSASLSFLDKRSGDRAVVDEGEFSPGESVGVTLITNEAPKAPIKLVCTAQ